MGLFKNFDRNKWLYNGLIITFIVLYAATAFVSFYHAITFFNIANAVWLSVILSFVAEIGQASVLFSILLTDNKNKFLPWLIMIILTTLQIIGNVVSSFDWIIGHNDAGVDGFKRSILFWVQTGDPEMFRVIIAWISGALLPVIALSMTALVAQNIELREKKLKEDDGLKNEPENASDDVKIDAKDIISEVSRIRPTEEDIEKLKHVLEHTPPKTKDDVIKEILVEEKNDAEEDIVSGVPFDEPIYNPEIATEAQSLLDMAEPEESYEPDDDLEHDTVITEKEQTNDYLDEEAERLVPPFNIQQNNGLVEGISVSPPVDYIENLTENDHEILPQEPSPTPSPSQNPQLTPDQLERIRQIARERDNLKKK